MRRILVVTSVVAALGLAACGSDNSSSTGSSTTVATTASSSTSTSSTSSSSTSSSSSSTSSTTSSATGSSATTSGTGTSATCPVGRYRAAASDMTKQLPDLPLVGTSDVTAKGSVLLDLRQDKTYTLTPEDYGLTLTGVIKGDVTVSGSLAGTYTTDGNTLKTDVKDDSLKATASLGGATLDASPLTDYVTKSLHLVSIPYQCQGQDLVLQQDNGTGGTVSVTWKQAS